MCNENLFCLGSILRNGALADWRVIWLIRWRVAHGVFRPAPSAKAYAQNACVQQLMVDSANPPVWMNMNFEQFLPWDVAL